MNGKNIYSTILPTHIISALLVSSFRREELIICWCLLLSSTPKLSTTVDDDSSIVSLNGANIKICSLLLFADVGGLSSLFFSFHMRFNLLFTMSSYWKPFLTKFTESIMHVAIMLLKPTFKSLITELSILKFAFVFYWHILVILLTIKEKKELLI